MLATLGRCSSACCCPSRLVGSVKTAPTVLSHPDMILESRLKAHEEGCYHPGCTKASRDMGNDSMIGTARIVMPEAMVRLSTGRFKFSMAEQELCFFAGANSIFTDDKLLTTPNNDFDADKLMFKMLGLVHF